MRIAEISPYPPPGRRHVYGSGVMSYTKNFVEALKSINPKTEIHVIADKRKDLPKLYGDSGVTVHRAFNFNLLYVFQAFKEACKIKPDITHVQHEYFLYGKNLSAALFPLLIALLKLCSRKTVVTLHGVVPLKLLDAEEFRRENGIHGPPMLLKMGLLLITKLIALVADKIIVHEEFLKEYLIKDYKVSPAKIAVIPHGVEDLKPIPQNLAKEKLGLQGKTVLLYFGYLTGYKGVKELINAYREIARIIPNTVLIIAGGPHPRLLNEKWYKHWLRDIIDKITAINTQGSGKVILTGYVPEDKIIDLFSAADIVILPYKARIAASGVEAIAISLGKPYLLIEHAGEARKIADTVLNSLNSLNMVTQSEKVNMIKKTRLWRKVAEKHLLIFNELLKTLKTLR